MLKALNRAISLLLTLALAVDPAAAGLHALSAPLTCPVYHSAPLVFTEQAVNTPIVETLRPLTKHFIPARGWQARLALRLHDQTGALYLHPAPSPDTVVMEIVQSYYQTRDQLRNAFLAGRPDAYRDAYSQLQKI